jgi:D-alanyl-D-alanine carboxypeptidase
MRNKKLFNILIPSILLSTCCTTTLAFTSKITLPSPNKQCNLDCIKHVQSLLDQYRVAANIPGIQLTVSFPEQPMQIFCSGTITKNGNILINKSTKFEIGSTTKSFTAAIALQLEEKGKFNLDDKIGKWFDKEYPLWQDNTIHDLLNMTSTTLDYFDGDNGKFQATYEKDPNHIWTTKELSDWVYSGGPNCTRTNKLTPFCAEKPGQGWSYSNTNYILLERVIEKTTHKSLQTLMYQRIFNPLKMHDSIYKPLQNPSEIDNFAHAYNNDPKSSAYGKDVTNFSLSPARAAGAIVSTTTDLAKWVRALFTGKILSPQQMAKMINSVCVTDSNDCKAGESMPAKSMETAYSCGLLRVVDKETKQVFWAHTGASEGHASIFMYDPRNQAIISAAQNMTPSSPAINQLANDVRKYLGK